ncbi:MAG TPA: hypothetical protein VNN18_02450 [Candidatus Xenobia bacterium]|nr:hypothetical protein [Candidatus Xenobia bacterium]
MNGTADKLAALLGNPPSRKSDVVDALGEIRRLLEQRGERRRLTTLNLFCDWGAQGKLDPEPAWEILRRLDDDLGRYDVADPDSKEPAEALDLVSFSSLRDELEELCDWLGLPLTWTEDDGVWDKVVALFAEAARKSPLRLRAKECGFTRLREVVLTVFQADESLVGPQPGPVFGVKWECTLADGSTYNLSRVEVPADGPEDEPDDVA